MANPNPFYRFKPAWNFGFFPDNQITSDLLNEISVSINSAIGAYIIPTTKFAQLVNFIRLFVADYNKQPYYGKFDVTNTYNTTTGAWTIKVFNKDLVATDSTQEIVISGTSNPSNTESISYTIAFTVGNYSGTYGPTLINEELKIQEALQCVSLNGSAIFPITYKYDPSLGVATSGLARGMNWQLSNGAINRLPIETTPRQNRRTFELPQLTGDDTYVLSIIERIIQGAFTYVDFNYSILPVYNSFTPPDGWTFSYNYPSFTTYERVQFNFVNPSRRKFILVGRRIGNTYLWQRFVSDSYLNAPYDFLSVYTESTQLPYEPNQAGRWLYNNDTYDFEFVEFTSGCYDSGEFYAMPVKPGDQLQFNIIDANLTDLESVNIGLFEEDGTFVQKIGEADVSVLACPCAPSQTCSLVLTHTIADADWNQYLTNLSQYNDGPVSVRFDVVKDTTTIATGALSYVAPPTVFTTTDVQDVVENLTGLTLIQSGGFYIFSYTIAAAECGSTYFLRNVITDANAQPPQPTIVVFASETYSCNNGTNGNQHYGSVTIPSKQGCYRFGLYSSTSNGGGGGSNCNLTFTKSLTGAEYDTWIQDFVTVMYSGTKRVGWQIDGLTQMYIYDGNTYLPPYDPVDVIAWCNTNIPGMSATIQPVSSTVTWTWTVNVPCGTTDYSMVNCEVNVLTEDCVNNLWTTASQNCPCSGSGANCNLTFTKSISGTEYDNWIASYVTLMAVGSKRIKWSIPEIPLSYILDGNVVSPPASPTEIADWCNNNIPGMVATYAQQPDVFTWTWTVNVPCGSTAYTMLNCEVNSLTEDCTTTLWTTDAQNCPCSGSDSYLYSLSNIINIDRADCFSTILEFWADSNAIAQGNEYYSDWKQRVRIGLNGGGEKPIIEESLYRQSNGVHRRPQNKQDLSIDLHTDFFDLETQLAMTDATRHPNLVWEGKPIFVKGDIEVATIQDFTTQSSFETLSQMKFQALLQGFQPKNSTCVNC